MRIVFMGSPDFALPSLQILLQNNYDIVAIVTVPDKPAGRGLKVTSSSVKKFALQHKMKLFQPKLLSDINFVSELEKLNADLFVVVAFRILPPQIFNMPQSGSFNLHASLLPRYRGPAPINWAIIRGEKETGVTTFFLRENVDTGNIILQRRIPIGPDDTAGEMHDKLSVLGAQVVLDTVKLIERGDVKSYPQDNSLSSSAPKIRKEDCRIDWSLPVTDLHNFIRGLSPKPTAYTRHGKVHIKIYRTKIFSESDVSDPGIILKSAHSLIVGTGKGSLEILEIQQEGKRRMSIDEFLRGYSLKEGDKFNP